MVKSDFGGALGRSRGVQREHRRTRRQHDRGGWGRGPRASFARTCGFLTGARSSSTALWRHRPARGRLSPLPRRKGAHKQRGERPVSAGRVSRPCVRVVESRICPVRVRSCCRIWPISTVIPVALDHPRHPSGQPTFKVLPCWVQKDVMVRAELSDTIRGNDMPRSDLRAYRLRLGM